MRDEKKYFLKNSDMYKEMQKSKLTYCCYDKEHYDGHFDIVVEDYSLITPNMIQQWFAKKNSGDNVIIRVMTDEHVKDHETNGELNLQELRMPPFKQFKITKENAQKCLDEFMSNEEKIEEYNLEILKLKSRINNDDRGIRSNKLNKVKQEPFKKDKLECKEKINEYKNKIKVLCNDFSKEVIKHSEEVVRSHWSGDTIETGHFDISQGKLTEGLVIQIMMLVSKYAKSGNWASYTFRDDMESAALLQLCDTALKFEEVKGNNVFAYLTSIASNKFTAILNSEKTQRKIKSKLMQKAGYDATFNEQIEYEFRNRLAEELEDLDNDMKNDNDDDEDEFSQDLQL